MVVFQTTAQDLNLRKGVVMDGMVVNDTIDETYSLYLPSSFEDGQLMPVLFIFDSKGRGRTAAQLFKPAAEEQGYILVSSNDIKPAASLKENLMVANRLILGFTSRIPVDLDRISVAGFAEGGIIASSVPYLFKNIHGVIAVGDNNIDYQMLREVGEFVFIGIAGQEQMSYHSMQVAVEDLKSKGFPSEMYSYNGGAEWPHPEVVSSALGFLSLEAMKENLQPLNTEMVSNLYEQDLKRVDKLVSQEKYVSAYDLMDVLLSKYKGLIDLSTLKEKQKQLKTSENYKEQQAIYDEVREKEIRLVDDFFYFFNEDVATANFDNLGWWNYQVLQLDQYVEGENSAEVAMGQRLQTLLKQMSKAKKEELSQAEDVSLEQKLIANMLHTIFDQQAFPAYLEIIELSTRDGDFSTALFYLEELLKNGFKDMDALYEIEGTLGLRLNRDFNWLIHKYLGESKFFTETFRG